MIAYPHSEAVLAPLQLTKAERWVTRVALPEMIIPDGEFLNITGQRVEQTPEPARGNRAHLLDGHSRTSPAANSLSASANKKSNLPVEESRSICSSQRACSSARNHWAMRLYSSGGRLLMAASISSTRSMFRV